MDDTEGHLIIKLGTDITSDCLPLLLSTRLFRHVLTFNDFFRQNYSVVGRRNFWEGFGVP